MKLFENTSSFFIYAKLDKKIESLLEEVIPRNYFHK